MIHSKCLPTHNWEKVIKGTQDAAERIMYEYETALDPQDEKYWVKVDTIRAIIETCLGEALEPEAQVDTITEPPDEFVR